MSIYGSLPAPSDEEHTDECARWEKHGDAWEISDRSCDCGQPDAPLVYQGSHVLPSENDPRGGWVDLASIPGFITRDGRDDHPDDTPWPYLRFGVNERTVVLTLHNVREVHRTLSEWIDEQDRARVAREDHDAEVRLRGLERVAELEKEANR